jgi:hypothetical protein
VGNRRGESGLGGEQWWWGLGTVLGPRAGNWSWAGVG